MYILLDGWVFIVKGVPGGSEPPEERLRERERGDSDPRNHGHSPPWASRHSMLVHETKHGMLRGRWPAHARVCGRRGPGSHRNVLPSLSARDCPRMEWWPPSSPSPSSPRPRSHGTFYRLSSTPRYTPGDVLPLVLAPPCSCLCLPHWMTAWNARLTPSLPLPLDLAPSSSRRTPPGRGTAHQGALPWSRPRHCRALASQRCPRHRQVQVPGPPGSHRGAARLRGPPAPLPAR